MKPAWGLLLAVLGLAALLGLANWLRKPAQQTMVQVSCSDLTVACTIPLAGQALTVRADRPPSGLKPFRLEIAGGAVPMTARFGMVGMDMGPIAIPLQPAGEGQLAALVVLPLCVQGRRDWRLWLESPKGTIAVNFTASS
ncbi:hypothetical protein [Chitinimonas naiadis]